VGICKNFIYIYLNYARKPLYENKHKDLRENDFFSDMNYDFPLSRRAVINSYCSVLQGLVKAVTCGVNDWQKERQPKKENENV
jgi:hypothetical protein